MSDGLNPKDFGRQRIAVGDAMLSYVDVKIGAKFGTADSPAGKPLPTLLLVHGFPLSSAMWLPVIEQLTKTLPCSCRVIAPDLRGYGESTLGTPPTDLADYADDLAQLLEAIGVKEPVVFVGFSMGGYIVWPFLERHAEKVAALVLADTRAGDDTEAARKTRLKMADKVAEWGAARIAELMRPNLFAAGTDLAIIDETVQVIASTSPASIAASQRAMAARPDSTSRLSTISLPTQVIVGDQDAISTPEEMRSMSEAIPNAQLSILAGAGHMTPVECPEAFVRALATLLERMGS